MIKESLDRVLFDTAKQVYEGILTKNDGINNVVQELNMNRGSAQMIIVQIFPKLLEGQKFTRTLSVDLFNNFLKFLLEDYGTEQLLKSLDALRMHIDYIKDKGDSKIKLRQVYLKYLDVVTVNYKASFVDEIEQEEIVRFLRFRKTKNELIAELKNSVKTNSIKTTINHKSYKRNNKIIAIIKILRNFECQICGMSIIKRDGTKYIEAAHIIPKHKKGNESLKNIILLCPNHHKEFDLGNREIVKHSENQFEFNLNGKTHKLNLKID